MIDIGLLILATVVLYLMRTFIQRRIQGVVLLMGGSKRTSIQVYSLMFLPGVIIHELTHFFTAALLGVRTGEIHIFPKDLETDSDRVALGSVKIAQTDFIRSSLIGAAPFLVGCIAIYALVNIYFSPPDVSLSLEQSVDYVQTQLSVMTTLTSWLVLYLILAIGNTMFVSKEDARSWPILAIIAGVLLTITIWTGNLARLEASVVPALANLSRSLLTSFVFVIIADLVMAGVLYGWEKVLERMTGKRIAYS